MAPAHPLPATFEDAIKMTESILRESPALVSRGSLEPEVEQLVVGAYRLSTGRGRTFSRNDLYVRVFHPFPREAAEKLITLAHRRASGEPLQYLLGYQQFLNHEYEVNPAVLIPRPETEILVFEVMQFFKRRIVQPEIGFEVGLGSGCISIELLKLFPELKMQGSEVSLEAVDVATRNGIRILGNLDRLEIKVQKERGDVLSGFRGRADFLVSNPPYLASPAEIDEDVYKYEPHVALLAPKGDPLYFYRVIAEGVDQVLKPGGVVFLEIPHERDQEILRLFSSREWRSELIQDLTGRNRVLRAEWMMKLDG